ALVAARELYSVVPVAIEPRAARERHVVVAGSVSPVPTAGGLRQMPAGSVSADNASLRPGSGQVNNTRAQASFASADNPLDGLASEVALSSALADNPPEARELGLYVHVPFCAKRCGYCSFNTAPLEDGAMARHLEALRRAIDLPGPPAWARPRGVRGGAGGRLREPERRSHVRPARPRPRRLDSRRRGSARLAARPSLRLWPHAGRRQPLGRGRRRGPADGRHAGRSVLAPRSGRRGARPRALRDLQLRAARLSLAPQSDLLARRRVPRRRTRRLRIRRPNALCEREGDAALLRDAHRGRPPHRVLRAPLGATASGRAADPRSPNFRWHPGGAARDAARRGLPPPWIRRRVAGADVLDRHGRPRATDRGRLPPVRRALRRIAIISANGCPSSRRARCGHP